MTPTPLDDNRRKALRSAGFLYFLMALTAPFGLLYVPGRLIAEGDAAATAENIRSSEWLLRLGIASELFHQAVAVFLVLALYRLFRAVNENQARLLVALGALVSVPIMFVNVLNEVAALILAGSPGLFPAFAPGQLDALAFLFMRLHAQGIEVASIFWGLWLFPFGILVIRSGFIPRALGILLFVAGSGYLANVLATFLLPEYSRAVGNVALVLEMGELPVLFWFLFRAVRPPG
jgi:hypothetical protein